MLVLSLPQNSCPSFFSTAFSHFYFSGVQVLDSKSCALHGLIHDYFVLSRIGKSDIFEHFVRACDSDSPIEALHSFSMSSSKYTSDISIKLLLRHQRLVTVYKSKYPLRTATITKRQHPVKTNQPLTSLA